MGARRRKTRVTGAAARQFQVWSNLRRQQLEHSEPPPDTLAADQAPLPFASGRRRQNEPPAHWLELVRAKAPGLLDGTGRGILQTRRPPPNASPPAPLTISAPDQTAAAGPLTQPPSAEPAAPDARTRYEQVQKRPAASGTHPALTFSASESPAATTPRYPRPSRRGAQPLAVSVPSDMPRQAGAPVETPAPHAPAYEAPSALSSAGELTSQRAESAPPSNLAINDSSAVSSWEWAAEEPPTEPVMSFPRFGEVSPLAPQQSTQLQDVTAAPRRERLPARDESEQAAPRAVFDEPSPHSENTGSINWHAAPEAYWPKLLRPDEPSNGDESSLLRAWKRRERIDQEQRGMGWSEPLS